ncbi:MAG: iron chaperone [Rhizobiaceae bacterium]
MAKTDFQSVDDYMATMPEATCKVLDEVRAIIRKVLPGAEEVISYQIPAYKQDGIAVIYFAGWKEHFSLYPVGESFAEAFPEEAKKYPIAKGTVRFALDEKVPTRLIRKIVKLRAKEAAEEAKAKAAKKSRRK